MGLFKRKAKNLEELETQLEEAGDKAGDRRTKEWQEAREKFMV